MADPAWGMLQKSMDDDETIEEAISRLITAHEGDPEAHLGAGESLETHRQNDIIDHPAGSIMPDKVGANVGIDGLTALNGYTLEVYDGTTGSFADLHWTTNLSAQTAYDAFIKVYFSAMYLDYDDFLDLSFYLSIMGSSTVNGTLQLTLDSDIGDYQGFAIRKSGNSYYLDALGGGGSPIDSVLLTSGSWTKARLRFVYDVVAQKAYAYLNGVLKMTVDGADIDEGIGRFKPAFVRLEMTRTTNTNLGFYVSGWAASYGLPNL